MDIHMIRLTICWTILIIVCNPLDILERYNILSDYQVKIIEMK